MKVNSLPLPTDGVRPAAISVALCDTSPTSVTKRRTPATSGRRHRGDRARTRGRRPRATQGGWNDKFCMNSDARAHKRIFVSVSTMLTISASFNKRLDTENYIHISNLKNLDAKEKDKSKEKDKKWEQD